MQCMLETQLPAKKGTISLHTKPNTELCMGAIFGNFQAAWKLPFLATSGQASRSCHKWQLPSRPRELPFLATSGQSSRSCQKWQLRSCRRVAIVGNIRGVLQSCQQWQLWLGTSILPVLVESMLLKCAKLGTLQLQA